MTVDQAIEKAAQKMNTIFAVKLREATNAMLSHGADRDEVEAFTTEQEAAFNEWRMNELDKLREKLLQDMTIH